MLRPSFPRALSLALALAAASVAVSGAPASAQADPLAVVAGETLDVTAEKLEVDIERGRAILEGDVKAALGELEVACPKVEIAYDEAPQVRWARGTGGVQMSIKGIAASADAVEVDVRKRRVKLSGGVRLTRGKGWVTAERATIDIATRKVSLHEVKGSIPVERPQR